MTPRLIQKHSVLRFPITLVQRQVPAFPVRIKRRFQRQPGVRRQSRQLRFGEQVHIAQTGLVVRAWERVPPVQQRIARFDVTLAQPNRRPGKRSRRQLRRILKLPDRKNRLAAGPKKTRRVDENRRLRRSSRNMMQRRETGDAIETPFSERVRPIRIEKIQLAVIDPERIGRKPRRQGARLG